MAERERTDPMNNRLQVIRFRLRWQGPLVWVAHLDRMRAVERALLRADLPLAFSQGYNPRPQIVFGLPSGAGIASEAEYVDVSLEEAIELSDAAGRFAAALPGGLEVLDFAEIPVEKATKLMGSVRAADYVFRRQGIAAFFRRLMEMDTLIVTKHSKGKDKPFDIRPLILSYECPDEDTVRLRALAGSRENLRPDLLLEALKLYAGDEDYLDTDVVKEEVWILPNKQADYLERPLPAENAVNTFPWTRG